MSVQTICEGVANWWNNHVQKTIAALLIVLTTLDISTLAGPVEQVFGQKGIKWVNELGLAVVLARALIGAKK